MEKCRRGNRFLAESWKLKAQSSKLCFGIWVFYFTIQKYCNIWANIYSEFTLYFVYDYYEIYQEIYFPSRYPFGGVFCVSSYKSYMSQSTCIWPQIFCQWYSRHTFCAYGRSTYTRFMNPPWYDRNDCPRDMNAAGIRYWWWTFAWWYRFFHLRNYLYHFMNTYIYLIIMIYDFAYDYEHTISNDKFLDFDSQKTIFFEMTLYSRTPWSQKLSWKFWELIIRLKLKAQSSKLQYLVYLVM